MNKKLSLAVAGAVLAFGASAANAGIIIPAGDWTVDLGGNVNTYYNNTNYSGNLSGKTTNTIQTGLLPSALGIGAKTRQNDLDIAIQFTFFTGTDSGSGQAFGNNSLNIRQAYLSFGDASWGTIKAGRDLGIFGSDAILSDMTLLGVGAGAGAGGSSTLGRIGSGYMYADWKGQISYASPNWNGFSFAAGATEGYKNGADASNHNLGFEGKLSYDFAATDVTGKVWLSGITEKHEAGVVTTAAGVDALGNPFAAVSTNVDGYTTTGIDIGGKVSAYGFGLVGYYYDGKGLSSGSSVTGTNLALNGGTSFAGTTKGDDNGGYVQATYTIPGVGTKLGASWGESKTDLKDGRGEFTNKSWIVGAYHPLTKSLNLVAEYTDNKIENDRAFATDGEGKARTISLGAILFY
ncbi:porin [Methyloradius palustris]|uniref:Porin domain-containing protein n=1 Tax=Methyloradius palustris TaxID=2778876 RepID=A0A8D5JMP1_9PROT|nr:porin [Methyloradius palustris]BCM26065.1 hypothetical protein ZMTM_23240 [Methyloradius palustris]